MTRLFFLGIVVAATAARAADGEIQYNRDIRPILADACFKCHGPDSAARKADLRIDQRDAAVEMGAIVPGKPDESEAVRRILSTDPDEVMPPPGQQNQLSDAQKEMLRRWVAAGAEYELHWSFLAPERPAPPPVRDEAWVRNPIDRFILARLEARGLTPAPEADRRTIARRVSLDLTGLPPAPEVVESFVNDTASDAYEKLVEQLMNSKRWGEHRGRYWLDVARYADTHGIHFDNFREIWAYRDWVIQAFNANMPFDQFTIEQLAGDLLPNPSLDQLVATGFNRCNITTNEGGVIPEEYLVLYTRDRTETVARVWMGLTMNCTTCHDHKFDPISQREFYELAAYLNNTTQGAMDGNIKDTPPVITVPLTADRVRWEALVPEIPAARGELDARKQAARQEFEKWLVGMNAESAAALLPTEGLAFLAPLGEGSGNALKMTVGGQPREVTLASGFAWDTGHLTPQALKIQPGETITLSDVGDFDTRQGFSYGCWVRLEKDVGGGPVFARMDDQHDYRGWDLWLENNRVGAHVIHKWQDDALKVVAQTPIKIGEWTHVFVTYDGSAKAGGLKVYLNGQRQTTDVQADSLKNTIRTEVPFKVAQRQVSPRVADIVLQDVRIYGRTLGDAELLQLAKTSRVQSLLAKAADQRSDAEKNEIYDWWLVTLDQTHQQLAARLAALEQEQADIKSRGTIAHVMQERTEPPTAYVLSRGEYDKRKDQVGPDTPDILPAMPAELPQNRLGLAHWLLRPEHPLTARVSVNRCWQEVFGTGLVRTSHDFGIAGELPSHPELLDWLAVEFRESGWDVKHLYRLLVTSAAYRQAALTTPVKLEADPQNRLLSRGPRFRMDAEMVRDFALAASGLLSDRIGGPSVRPYQPDGVWEAVAMIGSNTRDYQRDAGDNLYRRSMYTLWKRSAPPASMEIFNAPSREVCTVQRERTNTPLQALVTLNDPQFIEAARHLAQRSLLTGESLDRRLEFLARTLLSRPFRPEELAVVQASLQDLSVYYAEHPQDARELLAVGEAKSDPALEPSTAAAWTMLTNELMNLDEVLNK